VALNGHHSYLENYNSPPYAPLPLAPMPLS